MVLLPSSPMCFLCQWQKTREIKTERRQHRRAETLNESQFSLHLKRDLKMRDIRVERRSLCPTHQLPTGRIHLLHPTKLHSGHPPLLSPLLHLSLLRIHWPNKELVTTGTKHAPQVLGRKTFLISDFIVTPKLDLNQDNSAVNFIKSTPTSILWMKLAIFPNIYRQPKYCATCYCWWF